MSGPNCSCMLQLESDMLIALLARISSGAHLTAKGLEHGIFYF